MSVFLEIRSDAFGSFEVVVDFLSVEDVENKLAARMHEIFIDVVHYIVDYDVPDSSLFVVVESLLLLYQILENLAVIFLVFVFVFEEVLYYDQMRLRSVYYFKHEEEK